MDNTNIHDKHLGKKTLHLNGRGTGKLPLNIMSLMRQVNRSGHYIKFNYNYDLFDGYYIHPCTNYVDGENDIQNGPHQ